MMATTLSIKVPGLNGIINKIFQVISYQIAPHLVRIFNQSLVFGYCALYFKHSTTAVIRKLQKDDDITPRAYEPIALLNTIGKLIEGITTRRISYRTKTHQLLPDTRIGGRNDKFTDHAIHIIIELEYFGGLTKQCTPA